MPKALKNRASKQGYISTSQPLLEGFESPFSQHLSPDNRWVVWAKKIPWDTIVSVYQKKMGNHRTGADGINPRVAIGSVIIKHICDLSDRETVQLIQENLYMQYFIGYSSFSNEAPFDPSLFVEFRNRLGMEEINTISERILGLSVQKDEAAKPATIKEESKPPSPPIEVLAEPPATSEVLPEAPVAQGAENSEGEKSTGGQGQVVKAALADKVPNKGRVIMDATACPQDIRYPTDLHLLNDARRKSEQIIDVLYDPAQHGKKPRTYRKKARKVFLKTAQKRARTKREIRKAIKKQLNYLGRNIGHIHKLLDTYAVIPLDRHQHKYFFVIQTLYDQQHHMHKEKVHTVEHRIVSIHQPHVRPIVRGKTNANVEFGAKIQVSLMDGIAFLDDLSWEAFNEGTRLMGSVELFRKRFGCLPAEVLADQIYCTRANRAKLKELGIRLLAKPLGRPPAVKTEHVRPGERNPIEGKFGQAKTTYGLGRIKARLRCTSESWIATIIMVLNLVKLTGQVPYCLFTNSLAYSVRLVKKYSALVVHRLLERHGGRSGLFLKLTYSADPN